MPCPISGGSLGDNRLSARGLLGSGRGRRPAVGRGRSFAAGVRGKGDPAPDPRPGARPGGLFAANLLHKGSAPSRLQRLRAHGTWAARWSARCGPPTTWRLLIFTALGHHAESPRSGRTPSLARRPPGSLSGVLGVHRFTFGWRRGVHGSLRSHFGPPVSSPGSSRCSRAGLGGSAGVDNWGQCGRALHRLSPRVLPLIPPRRLAAPTLAGPAGWRPRGRSASRDPLSLGVFAARPRCRRWASTAKVPASLAVEDAAGLAKGLDLAQRDGPTTKRPQPAAFRRLGHADPGGRLPRAPPAPDDRCSRAAAPAGRASGESRTWGGSSAPPGRGFPDARRRRRIPASTGLLDGEETARRR